MIESHFRQQTQPLFDTIGHYCISNHITPMHITCCAFITGIISALCIAYGFTACAITFLLISGLCDVLDGTVARLSNTAHPLGAYCDLISDRMVEAAIIIGFAFIYPQNIFSYLLFFTAVLLHFSTFVVAGALFPNMGKKSMHYDHSLIERSEAFIIFFIMILLPQYISELLPALNIAIFITALTRFKRVTEYAHTLKIRN